MKAYLLQHNGLDRLHLVFANNPVEASIAFCKAIGAEPYFYKKGENGAPDQETPISVSGIFPVESGSVIDMHKFWMYFTNTTPHERESRRIL